MCTILHPFTILHRNWAKTNQGQIDPPQKLGQNDPGQNNLTDTAYFEHARTVKTTYSNTCAAKPYARVKNIWLLGSELESLTSADLISFIVSFPKLGGISVSLHTLPKQK